MENNKSALTGILLIVGILLIFNIFIFDTGNDQEDKIIKNNSINLNQEIDKSSENKKDNKEKQYYLGNENSKIQLTFSDIGGQIKSAKINNYYSYKEYLKSKDSSGYIPKNIEIFNNNRSNFNVSTNQHPDLYTKKFKCIDSSENILHFKKDLKDNASIEYIYKLTDPEKNYLDLTIICNNTSGEKMHWDIAAPQTEKSKERQRWYTEIYYKKENGGVSYISDETEFIETDLKWVAFKQHFFSTILIANDEFNNGGDFKVVNHEQDDDYIKTLSYSCDISKNKENHYKIYIGPNNYNELKGEQQNFEEIIDLGFIWIDSIVNKYIVINLLDWLQNKIGLTNFGFIILLITLIIKLVLSPLTYKSYLSQAKMKVLKPEVDKINEKHKKKDPMKAQKEVMNLYRKAGVNPLGGCLPMLVQFPILIAMFRFFPSSIELRQKSFLWAEDLSAFDSYFSWTNEIPLISWAYGNHVSIFTLLMTISTLIYTRMNSQMSSTQMPGMKYMMYMMPIMFLFFFNSYASGLTYYYLLANIFTFSQMYFMRKFVDDKKIYAQLEANKKKPPKPKSKFQKRLEEMQKQQEAKMKKRKK